LATGQGTPAPATQPAIGNRQLATGTGNRQPAPATGTGNRQPAPATGNRQPGTGNRQPASATGTGNRHRRRDRQKKYTRE